MKRRKSDAEMPSPPTGEGGAKGGEAGRMSVHTMEVALVAAMRSLDEGARSPEKMLQVRTALARITFDAHALLCAE